MNKALDAINFANIDWAGRSINIEYQWVGAGTRTAPVIVFLHEGLGSRAMWKDFPEQLCQATGCRGLVYSRPGYGRSTPRAADVAWGTDFMHRQAHEVLPALLQALGLTLENSPPIWLFGHSDGGSIALLFAAKGRSTYGTKLAGVIAVAPHILVEDVSVASIEQTKISYQTTALRARLARYHDDPDSAFWGWNDIWLHPNFRDWNITAEIAAITCPLLAVQGQEDEYGTLAQIHGIAQRVPHTVLCELADCGHSPHRDQPESLLATVAGFITKSQDPQADLKPR